MTRSMDEARQEVRIHALYASLRYNQNEAGTPGSRSMERLLRDAQRFEDWIRRPLNERTDR